MVEALNLDVLVFSSLYENTSISSNILFKISLCSILSTLLLFLFLITKSKFFLETFTIVFFDIKLSSTNFTVLGKEKKAKIIAKLTNENL